MWVYFDRRINDFRRPSSGFSRQSSVLCLLHRCLNLDELGLGILPAGSLDVFINGMVRIIMISTRSAIGTAGGMGTGEGGVVTLGEARGVALTAAGA